MLFLILDIFGGMESGGFKHNLPIVEIGKALGVRQVILGQLKPKLSISEENATKSTADYQAVNQEQSHGGSRECFGKLLPYIHTFTARNNYVLAFPW